MHFLAIPGLTKPVPVIMQGTRMLRCNQLDAGFALLDAAFAGGICGFDTAYCYGDGDGDRVLGAWLRNRGCADAVVVSAKGCGSREQVRPDIIAKQIGESLERMQSDRLDLWAFHRDDPGVPVGELVEAANAALRTGRISAYGASNWTVARLAEARAYASAHQLEPLRFSSPNFSLVELLESPWGSDCLTISGPAHAADRAWHRREDLPIFAWSSLAQGFLGGQIRSDDDAERRAAIDPRVQRCYGSEANWQRLARCEQLAAKRGWSVARVALAWVLSQDLPVVALIGCLRPEEVTANALLGDQRLSAAEVDWLDLRSASA